MKQAKTAETSKGDQGWFSLSIFSLVNSVPTINVNEMTDSLPRRRRKSPIELIVAILRVFDDKMEKALLAEVENEEPWIAKEEKMKNQIPNRHREIQLET